MICHTAMHIFKATLLVAMLCLAIPSEAGDSCTWCDNEVSKQLLECMCYSFGNILPEYSPSLIKLKNDLLKAQKAIPNEDGRMKDMIMEGALMDGFCFLLVTSNCSDKVIVNIFNNMDRCCRNVNGCSDRFLDNLLSAIKKEREKRRISSNSQQFKNQMQPYDRSQAGERVNHPSYYYNAPVQQTNVAKSSNEGNKFWVPFSPNKGQPYSNVPQQYNHYSNVPRQQTIATSTGENKFYSNEGNYQWKPLPANRQQPNFPNNANWNGLQKQPLHTYNQRYNPGLSDVYQNYPQNHKQIQDFSQGTVIRNNKQPYEKSSADYYSQNRYPSTDNWQYSKDKYPENHNGWISSEADAADYKNNEPKYNSPPNRGSFSESHQKENALKFAAIMYSMFHNNSFFNRCFHEHTKNDQVIAIIPYVCSEALLKCGYPQTVAQEISENCVPYLKEIPEGSSTENYAEAFCKLIMLYLYERNCISNNPDVDAAKIGHAFDDTFKDLENPTPPKDNHEKRGDSPADQQNSETRDQQKQSNAYQNDPYPGDTFTPSNKSTKNETIKGDQPREDAQTNDKNSTEKYLGGKTNNGTYGNEDGRGDKDEDYDYYYAWYTEGDECDEGNYDPDDGVINTTSLLKPNLSNSSNVNAEPSTNKFEQQPNENSTDVPISSKQPSKQSNSTNADHQKKSDTGKKRNNTAPLEPEKSKNNAVPQNKTELKNNDAPGTNVSNNSHNLDLNKTIANNDELKNRRDMLKKGILDCVKDNGYDYKKLSGLIANLTDFYCKQNPEWGYEKSMRTSLIDTVDCCMGFISEEEKKKKNNQQPQKIDDPVQLPPNSQQNGENTQQNDQILNYETRENSENSHSGEQEKTVYQPAVVYHPLQKNNVYFPQNEKMQKNKWHNDYETNGNPYTLKQDIPEHQAEPMNSAPKQPSSYFPRNNNWNTNKKIWQNQEMQQNIWRNDFQSKQNSNPIKQDTLIPQVKSMYTFPASTQQTNQVQNYNWDINNQSDSNSFSQIRNMNAYTEQFEQKPSVDKQIPFPENVNFAKSQYNGVKSPSWIQNENKDNWDAQRSSVYSPSFVPSGKQGIATQTYQVPKMQNGPNNFNFPQNPQQREMNTRFENQGFRDGRQPVNFQQYPVPSSQRDEQNWE